MFLRVDKLQIDLPAPKRQDPNAAAALQELLGGKYGEMSTLGNYMFQSFNFRSKSKLRPFYSLVAAITAEELGHVELVSNGVAMLNNGPDNDGDEEDGGDISDAPFEDMKDIRLAAAFLSGGGGAMPVNSNGQSWNNDFITTTGNVVLDLLHNFHLECGARLHKLRVYETLTDPTGREVCGYLLVRGSVHAHAYALALKKITGVEIEKMLPTPNIPLGNIPECQKYLDEGSHRRLYTFSPDDYKEMAGHLGQRRDGAARRSAGRAEGGRRHARRRQDPPAHRRALGLHAGLCPGGNVRDRHQALQGVALTGSGRGRSGLSRAFHRQPQAPGSSIGQSVMRFRSSATVKSSSGPATRSRTEMPAAWTRLGIAGDEGMPPVEVVPLAQQPIGAGLGQPGEAAHGIGRQAHAIGHLGLAVRVVAAAAGSGRRGGCSPHRCTSPRRYPRPRA